MFTKCVPINDMFARKCTKLFGSITEAREVRFIYILSYKMAYVYNI